ncbi:MAG: chloride channel protein [Pseudomonadota bacterium]
MRQQPFARWWRSDHVVLGVLALAAGALAGGGAILFGLAFHAVQASVLAPGMLVEVVASLAWYQLLLVPTLGGLLIGILCSRVLPGDQPNGVAQVIETVRFRGSGIPLAHGASAALVNSLAIGVGGSVGREGPIVHLGAAMASAVAERFRLDPRMARTLLASGVAAAIAAAFNAPIAGVLFALEVVIGHYALAALSPVVIASVIGTIVVRLYERDMAVPFLPPQEIASFLEFPAFALLGLVCGIVAVGLLKGIGLVHAAHEHWRVRRWLRPAIAGLVTGIIALGFPHVMGVGYETTVGALRDGMDLELVLALALAKCVATAVCLGSRFGGGIFSPALMLGALVGIGFGMLASSLTPGPSSSDALYGMLGMGAVAGAVLGAPLSTSAMIFELTQDYEMTLALMVTVAIATVFTMQIHGQSFFTWQLTTQGIEVDKPMEERLLARRHVRELLHRDYHLVGVDAPLVDLVHCFERSALPIYVEDDAGSFVGEVRFADLAAAAFEPTSDGLSAAADLARPAPLVLHAADDLDTAWRRVAMQSDDHVPVVVSADEPKLAGHVRQRDLVLAYNQAVLEARARERGER